MVPSPNTLRPSLPTSRGFTLLEGIIAMVILSFVLAGAFRALQVYSSKASRNLSKRLILQMEARRAILTLYKVVQEGI